MTIDHTGCVCIVGHACIYLICFLERLVKFFSISLYINLFIYLVKLICLMYIIYLLKPVLRILLKLLEFASIFFNVLTMHTYE